MTTIWRPKWSTRERLANDAKCRAHHGVLLNPTTTIARAPLFRPLCRLADLDRSANLTILTCSPTDWDLLVELAPSRITRLDTFARFFQGEVNQTKAARAGFLRPAGQGQLVTRGASICLYQVRGASQGEDLYLDVESFTGSGGPDTKIHHSRHERVILQESSPQNNFRRIIAARLPSGEFCNHTVNYTTTRHSTIDLSLILAVLNSSLAEWHFRLGSTNAHVSQYQLDTLPCPRFGTGDRKLKPDMIASIMDELRSGAYDRAEKALVELAVEGASATIEGAIIELVAFIEQRERTRGTISRTERSRLEPEAAQAQELIDKAILAMVGLEGRYDKLRQRLAVML